MICASFDRPIENAGVICRHCNPVVVPSSVSHRDLALTVRRLKSLVLASLVFGIFVAPFAIYIATKALHEHRATGNTDPAIGRQLVLMRRISVGLLVFWAFLIGAEVAAFRGM
jgi:hypothetical protein